MVAPASQQWWHEGWQGLFCCLIQIWRKSSRIPPSQNPLLEMQWGAAHSIANRNAATWRVAVQDKHSSCVREPESAPHSPFRRDEQHLRLPWESWSFLRALAKPRPLAKPTNPWEHSGDATARNHHPWHMSPGQPSPSWQETKQEALPQAALTVLRGF